MIFRALAVLTSAALLTIPSPFGSPGVADTTTSTPAGRYVHRITPVDSGPLADTGLVIVTLNNGASDVLAPCRVEDGRHCYWDASRRGNAHGTDWLRTRGRMFKVGNLSDLY